MTKTDPKADMLAAVAAAYASRTDVTADDIIALVARLRNEFNETETAEVAVSPQVQAPARTEPALPLEKAVTKDKVFCLCCGKGFKMLKRHLGAEHGLTETAYRAMFGLSEDMPLVAPSYSERKANYARRVGFGKYDRRDAGAGNSDAAENQSIS
ncbi:MAG: MucR family transcriptional regulator [Rhodobacterales bacterium]|nr:MucR family transcriptional regulator [Rhodobacterales bacterium]MDX5390021.1 MucR family transcriptional regulator [Rhodobacterales bacterium]MDX5489712.1 MucR family transcriptional regulator [Rhodobacterales bacterium]